MRTQDKRFIQAVAMLMILFTARCVLSPEQEAPLAATLTIQMNTRTRQSSVTLSPTMRAEASPTLEFLPTETRQPQPTPPAMGQILFTASEEDDTYRMNRWGGDSDIWLIEAEIETPRRWIDDELYKSQPIVSPDGTQVAYVVNTLLADQPGESVWIAEIDGTNSRQVSHLYKAQSPESPGSVASLRVVYVALCGWSADGQHLAYIVKGELWGEPRLLFVLDISTKETMQINGNDTLSAVWSPQDPDLLVMNQFVTPYLVNVRTGRQTKIEELEDQDIYSAWMPDGRSLFATVVDRAIHPVEREGMIIVDKDTRTSQWLNLEDVWGAWWSPDGHKIAYVSNLSGDEGVQEYSLLVMDEDAVSRKVLINQNRLSVYGLPFCWSLDSRWIVGFGYPTVYWTNATLYLVNVETEQMIGLATDLPGPIGGKMVWCYDAHCVNGGYRTR